MLCLMKVILMKGQKMLLVKKCCFDELNARQRHCCENLPGAVRFSSVSLTVHKRVRLSLPQNLSSGPGCSKLTMLLVYETLKFQALISQIFQHFLLKKCEKLLQCKIFTHFLLKNVRSFCSAISSLIFQQKISVYFVIKS